MAVRINYNAKLPTDAELQRMFAAVPALDRYSVADAVVRAGVKPITDRAKGLIPRSTASDRAKRSSQQRNAADWDTPLWKTIKVIVRKLDKGSAVAVTGPEFTGADGAGQKIYLIAEHKQTTRRVFYWGKDAGKTVNKIRNVMLQAADETRPEQLAAMKAMLRKKMDQVWRSNG